jgi:hypothetical protein
MQISRISLLLCALAASVLPLAAEDTPAQAAARQALEQKMKELDANPAAVPDATVAAPAATATPVVEVTPAGATATDGDAKNAALLAEKQKAQAAAQAKAEAKAEKAKQAALLAEQKRAAAAAKKQAAMEAKKRAEAEKSGLATVPAAAPAATVTTNSEAAALPISAAKQQKLDLLLFQYKADQITPEQYHEQRAAIIAEP